MQHPRESDPYLARLNRYGKQLDEFDLDLAALRHEFGDMREQIIMLSQANADLTRKVDMLMKRKP